MKRHYYISDDLDDLKHIEIELQENGLSTPQIHVLSEHDADVEKHHLHAIESVLKQDVVMSTIWGAIIGGIAASILLVTAYIMGWHTTAAGWIPFVFLATIILGFCTWEGGLIGIQIPNRQFKRFQALLHKGKHVFFVDITEQQQVILSTVVKNHPRLEHAGEGEATPEWVVKGQDKFQHFMKVMP